MVTNGPERRKAIVGPTGWPVCVETHLRWENSRRPQPQALAQIRQTFQMVSSSGSEAMPLLIERIGSDRFAGHLRL